MRFLGIDGEGQGRADHKYVLLAVNDAQSKRPIYIENSNGLTTRQCLDFLLRLPRDAKPFAYAFNYDLTKILQDLDNESLYLLFHEKERERKGKLAFKGPHPVLWPAPHMGQDMRFYRGYTLNLQASKFTVCKDGRTVTVWDIFKFFQGKFVQACDDWKVGTKAQLEHMRMMKDQRAEFDKLSFDEVRKYCLQECQFMADLAERLTDAHEKAGLHLKSYFGAGSSAAAMLENMSIKLALPKAADTRAIMKRIGDQIASGFFGGRFENAVIGVIEGRVYNYDISSAYPYQIYFLPCLLHGRWELTQARADIERSNVRAALVSWRYVSNPRITSWAPLPFRTENGSICYPNSSGGGWIWKEEFLASEKLFDGVEFQEAWVYRCECNCQPFKQIAEYYCERCRIGKEGPGIVLKLGCNSCYGKLAQSIGNAVFNNWIWAGMITSGCRAQLLEAAGCHRDLRNLLMVATDGIFSREQLDLPKPNDTGTWHAKDKGKLKPLGGWEEKIIDKGIFVARPGIYFPLNPTEAEIDKIRARGIGRSVVMKYWESLIDAYKRVGVNEVATVGELSRFCGAKTSISRSGKKGTYVYKRADGSKSVDGHDFPKYGNWVTRPVQMSFHPMPKRERVNEDGVTLRLRSLSTDERSAPYKKTVESIEALEMAAAMLEAEEQPDADLTDYEEEVA